jgi:hypothetical protein
MAATYDKIATTTLSSASATITFGSISSAYTDLRISLSSITTLPSRFNYFNIYDLILLILFIFIKIIS